MSELPPYIRDADQSPPPSPETVQGQAGRAAVSPVQESALPLSGGGAPPPLERYEQPSTQLLTPPAGAGGEPAAPQPGPVTQVVPPGRAQPAGRYTEDNYPYPYAGKGTANYTPPTDQAIPVPTTTGPGGGTVAQSPEPAKTTAAPVKPTAEDRPLATTPGAAALPQPEVASAPYKGQIPLAGYNWLANTKPDVFNTLASVAESLGVSTERLIQHGRMESDLNLNVRNGDAGEVGPFQIEPKTKKYLQDKYLGGRQIDAQTWEGGATLAALKIRECDRRGADSYASVACYNGGGEPGSPGDIKSRRYAAEYFSDKKSSDYSKLNFGDLDKPNGGSTMTANGFVQAAKISPDAAMRYVVDGASRGSSMSDAWQQVQDLMIQHFIGQGDIDGAMKAQDFVMQQAFMGSNMHLMGAMGSLQRGDGMTAAQQLAKAHAFFPDGTAGRFMTDGTNVFGVRLDETTGKPLGKPFQITAQDINSQLKFTGNPATFAKFLTDQQKAAAEMRLHNAQAGYQEARPAIEAGKEAGRNVRAAETINQAERNQMYATQRKQMEIDAKYNELKGAKDAETAKQVDTWATSDPMQAGWPVPPDYKTPQDQQAYTAKRDLLARGLKTTAPNMSIPDSQVKLIADGIIAGTYGILPTMNPKDPSQNGYVVVDPKTKHPLPGNFFINTNAGEAYSNQQHPARAAMQQQAGAASGGAAPSGGGGSATGAALASYASGNAVLGGASSVAGTSPAMSQAVLSMLPHMPPDIAREFQIISGQRSRDRQIEVYRGTGKPPPMNSRHITGDALDLSGAPRVIAWIRAHPEHGLGFPVRGPGEQNHMERINPRTGARAV